MWWECKMSSLHVNSEAPQNILNYNTCRTAYDADQPFAELLNTAMALPIFDGGNVGIRRRHMQDLMLSTDYDAWASTYGSLG
jgi:hypothetical protein